jgi:hypothetical protein
MEALVILALFVALAAASAAWGTDSRKPDDRWFPGPGRRPSG